MANVLIVDDSVFARRSLKTFLVQAGHTVVEEASNGIEALAKYKQTLPDFVTMDITMPLVGGIASVKNIMEIFPDAKIIMVSAIQQKFAVFDAIQAGAKHYILKPFNFEKIIAVVDSVLSDNAQEKFENRLKKEDAEPLKPKDSTTSSRFHLEQKNNIYIAHILKPLTISNFHHIKKAIQGLLSLKSLKVIFNFDDIEILDNTLLNKLIDLADSIRNANGKVVFYSNNYLFVEYLISKKIGMLVSFYSGTLDVSNIEM